MDLVSRRRLAVYIGCNPCSPVYLWLIDRPSTLAKRMAYTITMLAPTLISDLQSIYIETLTLNWFGNPLLAELTKSLGTLAGNLDNVHDPVAFLVLLQDRSIKLEPKLLDELLRPTLVAARKAQEYHIENSVNFPLLL